jgi:stress response protein YsnF
MTKIAVALYDDEAVAREVVSELRDAGVAESEISVVSHATTQGGAGATGYSASEGPLGRAGLSGNLLDNLIDLGVPRDEAEVYAEGTRRGGSLVLVRANDAQADEAAAIMERRQFVDYESRSAAWRAEGWTGYEASAAPYTSDEIAAERQRYATLETATPAYGGEERLATGEAVSSARAEEETSIPVVEEEIHVDKRTKRGHVRIHTFVEERPVEESVRLRDEEVTVERRTVDRPLSGAEAETAFRETDIEVEEVREEPVVSKEARVVEEVTVGKDVREREEVVRDTVRRTGVEVEDKTVGKGKERP